MTPDELKSMPRGSFITMKTGMHPMKTKFQLFLKWGISFEDPYVLPEHSERDVTYADRAKLEKDIREKYPKNQVLEQTSSKSSRPQGQIVANVDNSRKKEIRID